ncbi:hypothetical protein HPB50_025047 [Hyalomma asiaticum]|uniref:Uncharacterized protein n=1 Tax=Hyalomma asiaticum TaxID=266040 RepID=A0ACB7T9G8_HYAAI|nr:hypothetical protein HPB50_025047 [Hyalomma asiaticum]
MGHNVATFLWRTLLVQAIRRHYFATSLELLLVVVAFAGALQRQTPVPLGRNPNGTELDSILVSQRPTHVVLGPDTSYNRRLLEAVVDLYSAGDSKEDDGKEMSSALNASIASEVAKKCAEIAANREEGLVHPMCVALETPRGIDGRAADGSLTYTIYRPFLKDGFGTDGNRQYSCDIIVEHLPGWIFSGMNGGYRSEFIYTVYLVFMIPAIRRLNAIAYELSSGLAEMQALMGMSAVQFAAGHFLTAMSFYLVESGIAVTIMYAVGLRRYLEAYLDGINPIMVVVSFLLYDVGQALIPVFVTALFPKGWVRTLLFVALLVVAPALFAPGTVTVSEYLTMTRRSKLFGGVLPQSGLVSVMTIMFLAQDYEGEAGWSVVTRRVMGNNVTILEIWVLMFLSNVVIAFLTWYLPQILPWCADNPRSPLFFLTMRYWKVDDAEMEADATPLQRDPTRFEELPPDVRPIILTRDLTKLFGTVPVLNGVDLKVYERKVTVLLGHNGAGKSTLMRILTGTLGGPTSGVAIVCGYDVYNNREMVRSKVSLCQQSDIFFEDLTCGENALYFAALKDTGGVDVQKATANMLKKMGLKDARDKMPKDVSCGTLRMLSLAIAVASRPKLLMLDEPTAGLDPGTRRKIWDLLQQIGRERTVMLSSHDMFEVDAVADQIVVMSAGTVICSGSATFLKKACGDDVGVLCKPLLKRNQTPARSFKALFQKRLTYTTRSWGIFLVSYMLPLLLLWLLLQSVPVPAPKLLQDEHELYHLYGTSEIRLGYNFPGFTVVLQGSGCTATNLTQTLVVLVEAEGCNVRLVSDINKIRIDDLATYVRTYPMAVLLEPDRIRLMVDGTNPLTLPVLLNLVDTAVLRSLTRKPTSRIVARVSQLELREFTGRASIFVFWVMECAATYALAFSAFAAFPAAERLEGARDIQLMTGLSGSFFVFSHAAFDFIYYVAFVVPWCLIYGRGSGNSVDTCALVFATFVLSSPAMIGMAYVTSEGAPTEVGAMYSQFIWIYLGGIVLFFVSSLFAITGGHVWEYATLVFPPWALLSCFLKISSADIAAELCDRQRAAPSPTSRSGLAPATSTSLRVWRAIFPSWRVEDSGTSAADSDDDDTATWFSSPCEEAKPISFTHNGILPELLFLLVEGLVCLGIASYATAGYFSLAEAVFGRRWTQGSPAEDQNTLPNPGDPEVEEEKNLAIALCDKRAFTAHALVARGLCKSFGNRRVVRDFNLALKPSECFGLLGVHGSGKSTTFNMLAALTDATSGEANTATASMLENARKWQAQISYCQQNGGLLDKLSAHEFLYLIARLRGISPNDVEAAVNCIISIIDIKDNANKPCGAALLGVPPLLFLDEPYTGVDAMSRDRISGAVSRIKKATRTAVMLASHNIDECESLCDRLAIMADGRITCLGTLKQLRDKYTRGYRLELMLKHGVSPDATKLLEEANVLSYHLQERIPWRELFRKVELLERDFPIEYAIVGEKTLEQVFLSLVEASKVQPVASQ